MFTVIALTLLTSSVLIGLNFANWLVAPIRRLMAAADLVSTGDLKVQVPVNKSEGDLANLGSTFNKMTSELRTQRDDLVRASDVIDSRRRFIEAVLSSASAGIIGVDEENKIAVLNRSAEKLIGRPESEALGHLLSEIVPELNEMIASAREGMQRLVQGQIAISRAGKDRTLSVRVSAEQSGHTQDSYIITLDDITELVSAQRTSAWADVARRIAHEIKNPLTPIQLSAERIRRKYGKVIVEDRTVFDQCTDTIVRQVDDIRRMVDEFSRFARMPKPVIENEDVADTVRQVVFLMRVGHPDIDIDSEIKEDPMPARFDRRLISQGLQNIIKNASEAIAAVPPGGARQGPDRGARRARRRRHRHRCDRQRRRLAEGKQVAAAGAVCDDAREGDRPWAGDRRSHSRRSRRTHRAQRRLADHPGSAGRMDAASVCCGGRGRRNRSRMLQVPKLPQLPSKRSEPRSWPMIS